MPQKADPFVRVFGRELSPFIMSRVLGVIDQMRLDLKRCGLQVTLAPAPYPMHSGHMIRVVCNRNPFWYQKLYHDLDVKRDRIISSLERILGGKPSNKSSYDYMFLKEAKGRLLDGYDHDGVWVYPDNYARVFFGLDPIDVPMRELEPEWENDGLQF